MNPEKTLENYGLNKKQAKIYLACLELGSASVQKISQKAGLPRSTTYEVLESLREKGAISTFQKKKVKYFSAEDPRKLVNLAQERANLLEQVLPQLNALYGEAKVRPTVRFYQGKKEMKIIFKEILRGAKEILGFGAPEDIFAVFGDWWHEYVKERVRRKIPVRTILPDSKKARERQRLGSKQLREARIIPAKYTYHSLIVIWQHKIAMFSLKKELVALVVESEELAQVQKAMFYLIWDSLGE